ncbi:hypothetical protein [Mycolicibacterium palauense]|uniref:hypothetical protein n=1 Tax=Mycolicibacterium palauense TaxID=2034511 RepID=UPI000BFEFFE2|nr:hypothetical protein [Mycolicibacterium palauense]
MSYTVEDLDASIASGSWDDNDIPDRYGCCDGWDDFLEELEWGKKCVDIPDIGIAELSEQFGGEGQGDQYWAVVKILGEKGETRYFRRDGWYASFDGGYYEGPTDEVYPATETVTVWKTVA